MASNNPDNNEAAQISSLKKLRFSFLAYFFMGLLWLMFALAALVKWLFAPIALLFDILVLLPLGKFTVKIAAKPAFQEKQLDELPDAVWRYFVENRFVFRDYGFREGRYLYSEDISPGVGFYTMTMTNPQQGIGVGFMYMKVLKARDDSLDKTASEFTCIKDDVFVDMTNNSVTEPFLPTEGRIRLILEEYSNEQLYLIHRRFVETAGCRNNAKMLELLDSNPRLLMGDELRMFMANNIARGYMKHDNGGAVLRLTWKGALVSTLQTLWPMSVLYRNKLSRISHRYLEEFGINPDEIAWPFSDEGEVSKMDKPVDTVDDVLAQAAPVAARHGVTFPPVSIGVWFHRRDENTQIENIDVRYESSECFPQRGARWQTTLLISLNNIDKQILLQEKDRNMFTDEEYEEYGLEATTPFPEQPGELLAIPAIVQRISEITGDTTVAEPEGYLVLKMGNGRLCWTLMDDEDRQEIRLDAKSGELIT